MSGDSQFQISSEISKKNRFHFTLNERYANGITAIIKEAFYPYCPEIIKQKGVKTQQDEIDDNILIKYKDNVVKRASGLEVGKLIDQQVEFVVGSLKSVNKKKTEMEIFTSWKAELKKILDSSELLGQTKLIFTSCIKKSFMPINTQVPVGTSFVRSKFHKTKVMGLPKKEDEKKGSYVERKIKKQRNKSYSNFATAIDLLAFDQNKDELVIIEIKSGYEPYTLNSGKKMINTLFQLDDSYLTRHQIQIAITKFLFTSTYPSSPKPRAEIWRLPRLKSVVRIEFYPENEFMKSDEIVKSMLNDMSFSVSGQKRFKKLAKSINRKSFLISKKKKKSKK